MPRSKNRNTSFRPDKLMIDESPLHGQGVFATADIAEGEIIERCPYIVIDETDIGGDDSRLNDYLFTSPEDDKDFFMVMGYGMMYNHDKDGNAEWEIDDDDHRYITFTATRDIKAGEEILQDYGKEYWESRDDDEDEDEDED